MATRSQIEVWKRQSEQTQQKEKALKKLQRTAAKTWQSFRGWTQGERRKP